MSTMFELGVPQIGGWWLVTALVVAGWWVRYAAQHRNPRHDREIAWVVWHWWSGGPLEAARSYPTGGGRPRRAGLRAGRAIGRAGLSVGLMAAVYVRSGGSPGTGVGTVAVWALGGALWLSAVLVVVSMLAVYGLMQDRYVRPLHWAVHLAAAHDLETSPRKYIKIRRGLAGHPEGVILRCGPTFQPGDGKLDIVEDIVRKKLGLGTQSVSCGWKNEGQHRYVQFLTQDPIPDKVQFKDGAIRVLIEEQSTPSKVLLGLTRGGRPVWLDLDKSPHVLMSAGTGGGKSVTLAGIAAQMMWHGAEVDVLDIKRISHLWLRDLPGVNYARAIGEIHQSLLDLRAEVERRTRLWDPVTFEQREAGEVPRFPRRLIVFDEISSTMSRLRDHWNDVRESGDPTVSPAVRAYSDILNMGRQVQVNLFAAGQRGSANAVGSGDARENFEMVVMTRYSKKTWDMLAPECTYVPSISHAGRSQVVIGATATPTQMLWITERDAQRWVIDRRGMRPRKQPEEAVAHPAHTVSPGETVRDSRASATGQGVAPVTLWEASRDKGRGVVQLTAGALRAERKRHPGEFPAPVRVRGDGVEEYDPFDLQRYELNKVKQPKAAAGGTNETDGVGRVGTGGRELAEAEPVGGWLQPEGAQRDSDRDRFWGTVDRSEDGCWLWTGAVNGDGYGYFKADGKAVAVHRYAYEDQAGPIPAGLHIDHLIGPGEPCTSKLCVRREHLEAVPNAVNASRRHQRGARQQQGAAS